MKKPRQEEIPRSIIKSSGVIHTDLNFSKGKDKGKLLFVSPNCIVVGLNNLPYMLFTTPEFNENKLSENIKKDIFEVKEFFLQASFSTEANKPIKYCPLPKWLPNFKKIEDLKFERVELDDLDYLKDLPIQHLTFQNIKYNNSNKVIASIKQFKYLKEISYDQSLSNDLLHSLKGLKLKLTMIRNVKD